MKNLTDRIPAMLAACAFAILFASPATAQPRTDCAQKSGDEAIAACTQAIRQNPNDPQPFNNRGVEYAQKADYAAAIADFSEAIRINPNYTQAFNNRGAAYRDSKQPDRAIVDLNEALRQNPKYVNAFINRGHAYKDKNDRRRAISDYRAALDIDPGNAAARRALEDLGVSP